MQESEDVQVKQILTGFTRSASIKSSDGRTLELEIEEENGLKVETPVEIITAEAIYLGIVDFQRQRRLWVTVEHGIDRAIMEQIQSAWREPKANS